jgi:hypothetical protein
MEIPLISQIILYIIIVLFGLMGIIILGWQIMVLRGKSMKNPDGSVDDWHEQKLFYGIAIADVFLVIPATIAGIIMVFVSPHWGYYILALVSFWFLWTNVMTTATSLRFEKPKISFSWFIVFPFGALVGLAYIIWTLVHFDTIFFS